MKARIDGLANLIANLEINFKNWFNQFGALILNQDSAAAVDLSGEEQESKKNKNKIWIYTTPPAHEASSSLLKLK